MSCFDYDTESITSSESSIGTCSFGSDDFAIGLDEGPPHRNDNYARYKNAFKPVRADRGAQYPCYQQILDLLRRPNRPNTYHGVCCPRKMVADMIKQNDRPPTPKEHAAIARLHSALSKVNMDDWPPELSIKMFSDLDIVFFGGWLLGNTTVEWSDNCGGPLTWAATALPMTGKAHIMLNAKSILIRPIRSTPAKQSWATLLHEMCQ